MLRQAMRTSYPRLEAWELLVLDWRRPTVHIDDLPVVVVGPSRFGRRPVPNFSAGDLIELALGAT
jgi:hypothetical protein